MLDVELSAELRSAGWQGQRPLQSRAPRRPERLGGLDLHLAARLRHNGVDLSRCPIASPRFTWLQARGFGLLLSETRPDGQAYGHVFGGTPRTLRDSGLAGVLALQRIGSRDSGDQERSDPRTRAIQRLQMARRQPRASRRQPVTTCAPTALTTSARRPRGSAARPLGRCSLRSDASSGKGSSRGKGGRPSVGTERPEERAAANPTEPQELTRRDRPDAGRGITAA